MRNIAFNYKSIIDKLNLEALRCTPDGNVFTGYQILNNKKILFQDNKEMKVFIIPIMESTLKVKLEVVTLNKKYYVEEVKEDINLQVE